MERVVGELWSAPVFSFISHDLRPRQRESIREKIITQSMKEWLKGKVLYNTPFFLIGQRWLCSDGVESLLDPGSSSS